MDTILSWKEKLNGLFRVTILASLCVPVCATKDCCHLPGMVGRGVTQQDPY